MNDLEQRLRTAMQAAVDGEEPPAGLCELVQRRHRRHVTRMSAVAVTAAVVVIAIAAAAGPAAFTPGGPGSPPGSPSPSLRTITPSPTPSASITPPKGSWEPARLHGRPMPPGIDVRLLLTGSELGWFRLASRSFQPISGLVASKGGYGLRLVAGGWSVAPTGNVPRCAPACPAASVPVYFLANGAGAANPVGTGYWYTAPGSGGTIWITTVRPSSRHPRRATLMARQVTEAGQPIGAAVSLPAGYLVEAAVGGDLLLTPISGDSVVFDKLWDPRTRKTARTFSNVLATGPEEIAWRNICAGCGVHVLDLTTGRTCTIPIPRRSWAADGAISSDGRYLATRLYASVTRFGRASTVRIAVIDLARMRLRVLPGSTIGLDLTSSLSIGWQGASDELVAVVTGSGAGIQVGSWRPGARHLAVGGFVLPRGLFPQLAD